MRQLYIFLALLIGLSLFSVGVMAADIHVPADYVTIQLAVDAASDSDNIIVADGIYTGSGNHNINLRGLEITVRSENGAANCTLDCGNSFRAFLFISGEVINTTIDGFTIVNGEAQNGGAILFQSNSSGFVTNCIFQNNSATTNGGAILVEGGGHAIISNCSFTSNTADEDGGAIVTQQSTTQVDIIDCVFTTNSATRGGGIASINGSVQVSGSSFSSNESSRLGGGIYWSSYGSIVSCDFDTNIGGFEGGGGIFANDEPLLIDACSFTNNSTEQGAGGAANLRIIEAVVKNTNFSGNTARMGGGISCIAGSIVNCVFDSNSATDQFFEIGGGGLNCEEAVVANSLFINNSAVKIGGGIAATGPMQLINSTLSRNTAGTSGGGMAHSGSANSGQATVANTILWDNSATDGQQLALLDGFSGDPSEVLVTYSDLQGGEVDVYVRGDSILSWGAGNIDANPLFIDPDLGDFHASAGSPVIDAADNFLVPPDTADIDDDGDIFETLPLDLDLLDRFIDDPNTVDTGNGTTPIVDMGVYEFPPETGITIVCPDTSVINRGIETGGGIDNLCLSDDADWSFQPDALAATVVAPINTELGGTSSVSDGSEITFSFEVAASHTGVVLRIEIFNFTSTSWEGSVFPNIATSDTVYSVSRDANVSDYIGGSSEVRARVSFLRPAGVPPFWNIGMDQAIWTIVE